MTLLLTTLALAQDLVEPCEFNYPIAGSSGFANAQTGRRTNRNTYSAANFAERALIDDAPEFQWALEWNATFNAARVPTLCGDTDMTGKAHLYAEPLDLYASNMAISFETHSVGAFYSASVTQSVMGQRWFAVPSLIIQLYPMVSAPFVGVWQTGDGVASYSLDWIGGAHVDTQWFGARVGYTGIGGGYASFDERVVGAFGTLAIPLDGTDPFANQTPWSFLKAGIDRFDPSRVGLKDVAKKVGLTTFFYRDLPYGEALLDAAQGALAATKDGEGDLADQAADQTRALAEGRLKTLHLEQANIWERFDLDIAVAVSPEVQLHDSMIAFHSPGYVRGRLVDKSAAARYEESEGFLIKAGVVTLPAQYTLGVEGGTFFTARAEYRSKVGVYVILLFNDPEQLALYPFAVNALSARVSLTLGPR